MTGLMVRAEKPWPGSTVVFLILAALMACWAVSDPKDFPAPWFGAGLFVVCAVVRWLAEPQPLEIWLDDREFTIYPSHETYRYTDVLAVATHRPHGGRDTDRYPIIIQLADRDLEIPAKLNIPSSEVEAVFASRIKNERALPADPLADRVQEALEKFGDQRVWWACGISHPDRVRKNRGLLVTSLFCLVAAIGIIVYGVNTRKDAFVGVGSLGLLTGFIVLPFSLLPARRRGAAARVKNASRAGILISPLGLAIIQGDIRGEATWEEIKNVQFRTRPPHFALTGHGLAPGIDIILAGATVRILDIYDRPLQEIHDRILAYWQ